MGGAREAVNDRRSGAIAVVRFGEKGHLQALRDEGLVYMNSLAYFASKEADAVRADRTEGVDGHYQPDDITHLSVSQGSETLGLEPAGPFMCSMGHTSNWNVLCGCLIRAPKQGPLVDPSNERFGDSFVLILDPQVFVDRLRNAVSELGHTLEHRAVQYEDLSTYSGEWGAFRKPASMSAQCEYRLRGEARDREAACPETRFAQEGSLASDANEGNQLTPQVRARRVTTIPLENRRGASRRAARRQGR